MKKLFLLVLLALWTSNGRSMSEAHGPIQAYFLPKDQGAWKYDLYSSLNGAKRQVLVAMYWITDPQIIGKLIQLKKLGIDVKIIFDESSPDSHSLANTFLENQIIPIMRPTSFYGIMHNKFVVIDDNLVLTGSANFTKVTLEQSEKFNNENILAIRIPSIAKEYVAAFFEIEEAIIKPYIYLIAQGILLSDYSKVIVSRLYEKNPTFTKILHDIFERSDSMQKERLLKFFPIEKSTWADDPTVKQKTFLWEKGISSVGMTRKEAFDLIGRLLGKFPQ